MKEIIGETNVLHYLKKGDERAFRFIYDHYYAGLCRFARGYLTDPHLSESIVADIIYNLWVNHDKIDIQVSLIKYLYKSVSNRSINYLQLEYIKRETTYSAQDTGIINHLWTMEDNNPIEKLIEDELTRKVYEAVEQLSAETKQVFTLSRFENKKYEEIAGIMGISINTVKYHIKNALAHLREKLKDYLTILVIFISGIVKL